MKIDKLKQYVSLREQLLRDKAELESRLAEINKALGSVTPSAPAVVATAPAAKRGRKPAAVPAAAPAAAPASPAVKRGGKRAKNTVSLRDAVLAATKAKPLARQEILTAVQAAGYKFAAKDPLNSLSTLLYTDKGIKNYGGKFGPV